MLFPGPTGVVAPKGGNASAFEYERGKVGAGENDWQGAFARYKAVNADEMLRVRKARQEAYGLGPGGQMDACQQLAQEMLKGA